MDWVSTFILFITALATIIIFYKKSFEKLKSSNIPHPPPSIPFGNFNPMNKSIGIRVFLNELYKTYKSRGEKYFGFYMFSKPVFVPTDPELIKSVLAKDFDHFMNRRFYYNEKDDPLSAHLFALTHESWRPLRTKLTPTFTSGKMKMMFSTLVKVSKQLEEGIQEMTKRREPLDIKDVLGRFSTDIIGSCAFGIDCNTFKDKDSDFRKYGKKVFNISFTENIRLLFGLNYPTFARKLGIKFNKPDVIEFFMNMVKGTVKYREENNVTRKDFLQILIDLKNSNTEDAITFNELAAQVFVFFLAGFETSSTVMTFALFELAQNQDLQDKVRREITEVLARHNDELTYDGIKEMKYLEMVLDESMRKYPPLWCLDRTCVKAYKIPGGGVIQPGTQVVIPCYSIQHDSEYYPDPEKFDPDRFLEEEKKNRHAFTFLPFGEGPRNCIGMRFGLMQSKVGMCTILKNFKVTLNEKTELPLKMGLYTPILHTVDPIWLDAQKI